MKCGAFVSFDRSGPVRTPDRTVEPASQTNEPDPVGPPAGPLLYLSRRLDWFTIPAESAAYWYPVVMIGSNPYYRVTPAVFVWFELMLLSKCDDPKCDLRDKKEIGEVWGQVVMPNAQTAFGAEELAAARKRKGHLPPAPEVPGELPTKTPPKHLARMTN